MPCPFVPYPSAPSPRDAAPHLDLGSSIFKFQTLLGGRKQVGGMEGVLNTQCALASHGCP